jgi:UDP-3-O-[3-hydroxymyristoyl] glucosamine N-acyltransferase
VKLKELASLLKGEIVSGNGDIDITGVSGISDATAGDITFLSSKK